MAPTSNPWDQAALPSSLPAGGKPAGGNSDQPQAQPGLSFAEGGSSTFGELACFSAEDRAAMGPISEWMVTAEPSLTGEAGAVQCCVRALGPPAGPPVLCLHGLGKDRGAAFFAGFFPALARAGHRVLTLDLPGHGMASGSKQLAARGGKSGELVLGILRALGASGACCFADAGGCSTFLRAFSLQPALFGPHHLLLNPITGEPAAPFKLLMERHGVDLKVLMADGWGAKDQPFTIATCGAFFEFLGLMPDRAEIVILVPPRGPSSINSPGMKPMRPTEWLHGEPTGGGGGFPTRPFVLRPAVECCEEVTGYLQQPRREAVREDGGPHAPTASALESGAENQNFKVYVRIRPMLAREAGSGSIAKVEDVQGFPRAVPPQRLTLAQATSSARSSGDSSFVFDRCFEPGSQAEVCAAVAAPLVAAVAAGTNATLFAYGQTGSGKTFTMEGPAGQEGCVQFAATQLFASLPAGHAVSFQYVQLYNTEFLDLLDPPTDLAAPQKKLAIEEGKKFMCMRGATLARASSAPEMLAQVARGAKFRATGATNMNDASSRSHAILIVVCAPEGGKEPPLGDAGAAFYLVDLAGSERTKRSGVQGKAFSEATAINTALSALGRVVTSLVERDGQRAAHISYKDNPLTQLLKMALGGASRTALVACITAAADSLDESLNTLRFAAQASHVKNKVAKKQEKDDQKATAAAITTKGNALVLDAEGCGAVPLSDGRQLAVRGHWGDLADGKPTVLCIHDFGQDTSQFAEVVAALEGKAHVLAPSFEFKSEKYERGAEVMGPPVAAVLDLLTWLGVSKPSVVYGVDFGAAVAAAFKQAHKTRCGGMVLHFRRLDIDEKAYKAKVKADPMFEMNMWYGPTNYFYNMLEQDENKRTLNCKGIGKPVFLFPCSNCGRPDPTKRGTQSKMAVRITGALKVELVDCFMMPTDQLAKQILKVAGAKKKT